MVTDWLYAIKIQKYPLAVAKDSYKYNRCTTNFPNSI